MKKFIIAALLFIMPVTAYACDYCAKATIYKTKTSAYHIVPISIKTWDKGGINYITLIMWEEHTPEVMQKRIEEYSLTKKDAEQVKTIYTQLEICLEDKEYRILNTLLYNENHMLLQNGINIENLKWQPCSKKAHIKSLTEILEKEFKKDRP